MVSVREEGLFVQTQNLEDEGGINDNVYVELAVAITERKCRIVQKREKIKLMINEGIKIREQLNLLENEQKRLKKDIEEVSHQKTLRVKNLQDAQKTHSTMETTVCDLNNQVCAEKAETKRKKDEFDAAIKDAKETWESYKEIYENFPLARKLRGLEIEEKKIEIAIKQAEMDIADLKMKKKLKRDIAERKFHLSVVKLAEKYCLYQEKVTQLKVLQKKEMEMKKLLADLKSGKASTQQLQSSQGSTWTVLRKEKQEVCTKPEPIQFTLPVMQVMSPPPASDNDSSQGGKLFDWTTIFSSAGLLGLSKKSTEKSTKPRSDPSLTKKTSANATTSISVEKTKENVTSYDKKAPSSMTLTNLLRNISARRRNPSINIGNKRSNQNETVREDSKLELPPCKKMLVEPPQGVTNSNVGPENFKDIEKTKNPLQSVTREKLITKNASIEKEDKGNTNARISNSSSNIESNVSNSVRSKVASLSKAMSKNLMDILTIQGSGSGKERKSSEPRNEENHDYARTIKNMPPTNVQKISPHDQPRSYNEGDYFQSANSDRQSGQYESIPMEANSQSSSQGNILQNCSPIDFHLSGGSDLISPEVDEVTAATYKRMVAQGENLPQVFAGGKNPTTEDHMVRSQYFTGSPTLNTPPRGPDDYQSPSQPFSPPVMSGQFDDQNQLMTSIPSPPPANTGGFERSGPASTTSGFFAFGGSTQKPSKSVFDFF